MGGEVQSVPRYVVQSESESGPLGPFVLALWQK